MFLTRKHAILVRARAFLALPALRYFGKASSLIREGRFAVKSLSATENYTTKEQRKQIQILGNHFGCHTCGRNSWFRTWFQNLFNGQPKTIKFHADHIPPNSVIKRMKPEEGKEVKQRLYPQCSACVAKQASVCRHLKHRS